MRQSYDSKRAIRRVSRSRALLCFALLGGCGVLAVGATGWAQQKKSGQAESSSQRRILHEYFDPWSVQISGQASAGTGAASGAAGEQSIKKVAGQPPGLSLQPATDEMILGDQGPVDSGSTSTPWGPLDPGAGAPSRLDSSTDRVDQLNYWASFEPSVVPYKRVVVQNRVRQDGGAYSMELDPGRFHKVAVQGGAGRGDEEVFWGSFLIRAKAGERHPIPSVAPQQRVLSVQVAPRVGLRVERDGADNFYLLPSGDGLLRVNMKVAVPQTYFDGAISADTNWRKFSQIAQRRDARLSEPVNRVAAEVLKLSGASRQMTPRDALYALIEYYRDFEARPFPKELAGDDLYAAISRAQVGVCRHRSLAFVISARALGIPARYIYNEAHAFVEIYWPQMGWRRIDLGGAADQLDYSGRRGGGVHQAAPDALPQPPNYLSELDRMGANIPGYDGDQDDQAGGGDGDGDAASNPSGAQSGTSEQETTDGAAQEEVENRSAASETGESAMGESEQRELSDNNDLGATEPQQAAPATTSELQPGVDSDVENENEVENANKINDPPSSVASEPASEQASDTAAAPEADPRQAVRIDVVASNPDIFRGTALGLKGSIFSAQGRPIHSATIKIYLGPLGVESTEGLVLLGELQSDSGGRFVGQFAIPDDISIGRWSVVLRYEGSEKYLPAQVD